MAEQFEIKMNPIYAECESYEDSNFDFRVEIRSNGVPFYKNNCSLHEYSKKNAFPKFINKGIFVISLDNELYMSPRHTEIMHHSDFLKGQNVLSAGMYFLSRNGRLIAVSNKSGHYTPKFNCLIHIKNIIEKSYTQLIKYIKINNHKII